MTTKTGELWSETCVKVPNAENCSVDEEKVRRYLLDPSHPVGGSKAKLFLQAGFTSVNWPELAAALQAHCRTHDVSSTRQTPFGTIYVLSGSMDAPEGTLRNITTVWHLDTGALVPRLVTAYPARA